MIRGETYFINIVEDTITNGPTLQNARAEAVCHDMLINNASYIVVVGGGWGNWIDKEMSTEILSKDDHSTGWIKSKKIRICYTSHWGKNQFFYPEIAKILMLKNVNFVKNETLKM